MTNRELLEFAAKAAGLVLLIVPNVNQNDFDWWAYATNAKPNTAKPWNPLEEDGDALRLMVKLCMQVECSKGYQHVSVYGRDGTFSELHNGIDPCAATRRAIVRAAAEIGKHK